MAIPDCDFHLENCTEEAAYFVGIGGGGTRFACGPCMNATDEPDAFVPLSDLAEFTDL